MKKEEGMTNVDLMDGRIVTRLEPPEGCGELVDLSLTAAAVGKVLEEEKDEESKRWENAEAEREGVAEGRAKTGLVVLIFASVLKST